MVAWLKNAGLPLVARVYWSRSGQKDSCDLANIRRAQSNHRLESNAAFASSREHFASRYERHAMDIVTSGKPWAKKLSDVAHPRRQQRLVEGTASFRELPSSFQ